MTFSLIEKIGKDVHSLILSQLLSPATPSFPRVYKGSGYSGLGGGSLWAKSLATIPAASAEINTIAGQDTIPQKDQSDIG